MDKLKFYTGIYGLLRTPKHIHQYALTPIRRLVRKMANKSLPGYFDKHKLQVNAFIESDIIVSLTSFPARIDYVYLTIESLLRQTHCPRKVLLWLSLEQFKSKDCLPASLLKLENDVFEIRMVTSDLRSHKKYYYALREFPDSTLITVDDDVIYSPFLVESLAKNHKKFPNAIIANNTTRISYNKGKLNPYMKWEHRIENYACDNLVQIGVGGVLYPQGSLYRDVTNSEVFMRLCPYADDLWLNAMARLNNTIVVQSDFRNLVLPIEINNNQNLFSRNWSEDGNDKQLSSIMEYYKELDLKSSPQAPKVLLATSAATPKGGGIASYNQELTLALNKSYLFYLLTDSDERSVPGFKEILSTYGKKTSSFKDCLEIVNWINSQNFDVVIDSGSSFMPIICPFLNAPIVSISHFVDGILAHKAAYNSQFKSSIIALSYFSKTFIDNEFVIKDKNKVKVVYNFVAPSRHTINKENDSIMTLVFPGGSDVHKSVDVVLDAIYRLVHSNLKFRFIWLGGETLPSAKFSLLKKTRLRQLLPNDERVIYKGRVPREEAEKIIGSANVFVLPSRGEGCPMTLLEAMRMGCIPVVSDAHHGSREIVENCGGHIIRNGNGLDLSNVLKSIIINPDANKQYYDSTRIYSETELCREKWVSNMIDICEEAKSSFKFSIPMNRENFNVSYKGLSRYLLYDRIREMSISAYVRIKIDYLYLRFKIRGGKTLE